MKLRVSVLAMAMLCGLAAAPARANWLTCVATASDADGALEFHTTVADVGATGRARLAALQQRLVATVTKLNPDAQAPQAQCAGFDDQLAATSHYSGALNAAARRLGWNRISVIAPDDWLGAGDIVAEPAQP